ncbi:MAG: hypothetical protein K6T88_20560 [Bacillus sp. (in: Bacteria)]|nr:hypothetical protein [Bacillus sp. (in: firmicutes)]
MKKNINSQVWDSFIKVLENPETLKNFYNYYSAVICWVKAHDHYFSKELLVRNRLDILLNLEPETYIIDEPDLLLSMELKRIQEIGPKTKDSFLMIIGDTLWDLVTIKSGKDCPNCVYDELRYVLIVNKLKKEQKIVLECDSCGWSENTNGIPWDEGIVDTLPASKKDLIKFGIFVI